MSRAQPHRKTSSPPLMSANVNGPVDPMEEFYRGNYTPSPPPLAPHQLHNADNGNPALHAAQAAAAGSVGLTAAQRSFSRSPTRGKLRSASGPAQSSIGGKSLNNVRSNPVLLPSSRPPGSVKDIANRFNQVSAPGVIPPLSVRTNTNERYRRDVVKGRSPSSPTKLASGASKLQKRRPGAPKSPQKSPTTSFDTSSSFSSTATVLTTRSQPHAAFSPKKAKQMEQRTTRPLFGEITSDGQWNGNFDLDSYGQLPTFQPSMRRGSDGNLALSHGRSQSHQDFLEPSFAHADHKLHHKRSRSDITGFAPSQAPSMPNLNTQAIPPLYPSSPRSATKSALRKDSPASRLPVSSRRQSADTGSSAPQSRSASAMSNRGGRNKLSKSPTRRPATNDENSKPPTLQNRRYNPPPISLGNNQMLSAKIVAPLPKTSPPLRSSRPRQPVSAATTAASRARAAGTERTPGSIPPSKRPSEQWLGKPYDAQKERSRRRIPELGKVDFAERRARIQKAISQNLEESNSQESLRSHSRRQSRQPSGEQSIEALPEGQSDEPVNEVDQHQAQVLNHETEGLDTGQSPEPVKERPRGLSLDTAAPPLPELREPEPMTAGTEHTEFEFDESPILGRSVDEQPEQGRPAAAEEPTLLSAATYQPPAKIPSPIQPTESAPEEGVRSPGRNSLLENVMIMRQRSPSSTRESEEEGYGQGASTDESPSDIEDRWGLSNGFGDQGSIKIMLDDEPTATYHNHNNEPWEKDFERAYSESQAQRSDDELARSHAQNHEAFVSNGWSESPEHEGFPEEDLQETPRKNTYQEETLKNTVFQPTTAFAVSSNSAPRDSAISRALDEYNSTGTIAPELLEEMQKHTVDLDRLSHNGGSDAIMVQNLLDSIAHQREPEVPSTPKDEMQQIQYDEYGIPVVTPDTPPDAAYSTGTAVVYSKHTSYDGAAPDVSDDDFDAQIRKANEDWERQQNGEVDAMPGAEEEFRPTPPPKDAGYTPRHSTGPDNATLPPNLSAGLRISTSGQIDLGQIQAAGDAVASAPVSAPESRISSPTTLAPPPPSHAPPPPPPVPFGAPDVSQAPTAYSERGSSETSPRVRKNLWGPSPASSRPSVDSQRVPHAMPASVSMTSFGESTRVGSGDVSIDSTNMGKLTKTSSPGPEQKRLQKRRHVIMELLNTENSYHQDLKIIEDIYKATVGDFMSTEDKKILFGNCDEIERFSIGFYDEMRKSATPVYQPGKKSWNGKRGSMSTTQSDGTAWSTDSLDEEKDRGTTIGRCFLDNLASMETIYGAYLRNHDAANQRLSALQSSPTVKCWLDECHNNASDITSAWDLDSLLVKPTQRVSKYPLMLQQLLDCTPAEHPDYESLKAASKDSIAMLTRINDAKKRADLVEQMISRKGKDSDVRTGLAKAFGRRTEKLRERVGINEAFQDADFDALAHKFGGHYIRLQICMRDVQDYVNRVDKAVEQIGAFATALELYADVSACSLPEIASKWRRYGQVIRELTAVALAEHKATIHKRVITPMIACIKLHENPQAAIAKRKKRIVDYAKCKSIEKRGEKPDRKTIEAAEMYEALNDQLKIELPKLYDLTASLVRGCLNCFLDIQLNWQDTWQRKLRPLLEEADIPENVHDIAPAFHADYEIVRSRLTDLGICNGSVMANSENFLSPTSTIVGDSDSVNEKRPSTINSSKRTMSMGSDISPSLQTPSSSKRQSAVNTPDTAAMDMALLPNSGRMRSNSAMSGRGMPGMLSASGSASTNRPWSNSHSSSFNGTPASSFSSRPSTGNQYSSYPSQRPSMDQQPLTRPISQQTYFTAKPDQSVDPNSHRFSGIFSSALPPDTQDLSQIDTNSSATTTIAPATSSTSIAQPLSPTANPRPNANPDIHVLFVCASLFEFNIDKARKEAGYPYLTYVQGEVFDVIAQKGELWLAKNQDDATNTLGWIWEQHFVILSQD